MNETVKRIVRSWRRSETTFPFRVVSKDFWIAVVSRSYELFNREEIFSSNKENLAIKHDEKLHNLIEIEINLYADDLIRFRNVIYERQFNGHL